MTKVAASKERIKHSCTVEAKSLHLCSYTSCVQAVKALVKLHVCAGLSEPMLLADMIRPNKKIPVFRVT